jgi:hypothetical protein
VTLIDDPRSQFVRLGPLLLPDVVPREVAKPGYQDIRERDHALSVYPIGSGRQNSVEIPGWFFYRARKDVSILFRLYIVTSVTLKTCRQTIFFRVDPV